MIVCAIRRSSSPAQGLGWRLAEAWQPQNTRFFTTTRPLAKTRSDALRILFCGSDAFSCESLKALHAEHRRNRELVERVEVMVLPAKRVGRGLKEVREVPCKTLAEDLGLRVHERNTFRDWELPKGINLVVAVSFRLFVPPRILSSAKYGGLNVHPSLLPHLRGPAPIHHAMLRGDPYTGVSLQTLDPTAFDHGVILAQTPAPGIPIPEDQPLAKLTHKLAVRGGEMLVQGLRDGVHTAPPPPLRDASWVVVQEGDELVHAPKVTKADMQLDLAGAAWRAGDVPTKLRVFGSLWTHAVVAAGNKGAGTKWRVLFTSGLVVQRKTMPGLETAARRVVTFVSEGGSERDVPVRIDARSGLVYVEDGAGDWVYMWRAKVDGGVERDAAGALRPFLKQGQGRSENL